MSAKTMFSRFVLTLAVGCAACAPASAADVYRWVDADGVVHFSQWKPESADDTVETVAIDESATQGVGGDLYPVEDLSAEIDALRAEREEARAKRAASRQPEPPVVIYQEPAYPNLWPVYRPGGGNRPQRPDRPRPQPLPRPSPPASLKPPGGSN